jgi:hypothetical protein
VRLSKEEHEAAKAEAERLGISFAEPVRRSLRTLLQDNVARPRMRFAGKSIPATAISVGRSTMSSMATKTERNERLLERDYK